MIDLSFFEMLGKRAAARRKTRYNESGRNVKGVHMASALQAAGDSNQNHKGVFKWRSGSKRKVKKC